MLQITPQDALQLPLHDAVILGIAFSRPEEGFDEFSVKLKIHSDESANLLKFFPKIDGEFTLAFKKCFQINLKINCYCAGDEFIDSLDLVENSEIINILHLMDLGNQNLAHLRIRGSHGSCWDIVTASISIVNG